MSRFATTQEAYQWVLAEIEKEGERTGNPLEDYERRTLSLPASLVASTLEKQASIDLNNKVVALARGAMEHGKANGAPTEEVREGLHIPVAWADAYDLIWKAEDDSVFNAVLQNAMISNPLAGEESKWLSPPP